LSRLPASSFRHRARQRGAVLIVVLLVMVATFLAAIALVRSVDVATLISGNLAFRQTGMQAADSGVEVARKWLMTRPLDDLKNSIPTEAYFATWDGGVTTTIKVFDPKTFDWGASSKALVTDEAGNTVNYVMHRMCQNIGEPGLVNTNCFTAQGSSAEGTSNRIKEPGDLPCFNSDTGENLCAGDNPYYRITVRVTGPRGTVTYAQAVIY
jgi:type IV pilus assembly protein PilX